MWVVLGSAGSIPVIWVSTHIPFEWGGVGLGGRGRALRVFGRRWSYVVYNLKINRMQLVN
jgi:hypothetical protein